MKILGFFCPPWARPLPTRLLGRGWLSYQWERHLTSSSDGRWAPSNHCSLEPLTSSYIYTVCSTNWSSAFFNAKISSDVKSERKFIKTSFYVMKERHGTGRENQTKHQQKLNNLKPKYRINHKITRATLKCYPVRKLKRKQTFRKKRNPLKVLIAKDHCKLSLPKMQY